MMRRLQNDADCFNWLSSGFQGGKIATPELLADMRNRIGVAARIEVAGNNAPGIGAMALVSPAFDIIINGEGGFYYGGNIPGLSAEISASSDAGRTFILLHELAHVSGGLIGDNDATARINAQNNATVWRHCERAITGGN